MEAWDVIVLGEGPAAMRAGVESARTGASTLLLSSQNLGVGDACAIDGLAAPLLESTTKAYNDDTIRAGAFLCDQDIVAMRLSSAIKQVDLLEKWGVIWRRDSKGLPMVKSIFGHSKPRLTSAGDSLMRETHQVLEEQCIRRQVIRRGNQLPLELVHQDQKINGLVTLDLTTGLVQTLQAKTLIVADGGFEGAWNKSGAGLGLDLALRAGLPLKNMEFQTWSLVVANSDIIVPMGLLSDGATLHEEDGTELQLEMTATPTEIALLVNQSNQVVLDARSLEESKDWWSQFKNLLKKRLGINMQVETIPVECRPSATIGGIPTDEYGRAIFEKWSRWFTGLYAVGDAACTGVHGAEMIAGNRLLDALSGGAMAGKHAGEWSQKSEFSGRNNLEAASGSVEANLDSIFVKSEGAVLRKGAVSTKLFNLMNTYLGLNRNQSTLEKAISSLEELEQTSDSLYCDDKSRIFNENLRTNLSLQSAIRLSLASARAASSRKESRGSHRREDFKESDENQLHHTLVDLKGEISTLAVRKGPSGTWLLTPEF